MLRFIASSLYSKLLTVQGISALWKKWILMVWGGRRGWKGVRKRREEGGVAGVWWVLCSEDLTSSVKQRLWLMSPILNCWDSSSFWKTYDEPYWYFNFSCAVCQLLIESLSSVSFCDRINSTITFLEGFEGSCCCIRKRFTCFWR